MIRNTESKKGTIEKISEQKENLRRLNYELEEMAVIARLIQAGVFSGVTTNGSKWYLDVSFNYKVDQQ